MTFNDIWRCEKCGKKTLIVWFNNHGEHQFHCRNCGHLDSCFRKVDENGDVYINTDTDNYDWEYNMYRPGLI